MARQGTYVIPALSGGHRAAKELSAKGPKPGPRDKWFSQIDEKQDNFRRMVEAGVMVVAGTDAGCKWTYFGDIGYELELMVQAGISEMGAIAAATRTAAQALGVDSTAGTVEEGKEADIIAVDSDPFKDISSLRRPSMVMKAGMVAYQH